MALGYSNNNNPAPHGNNMQEKDMDTLKRWLFTQSPALVLAMGFLWLIWNQNEAIRAENTACNQSIIEIYQEQNARMIRALEGIEGYIKEQKK